MLICLSPRIRLRNKLKIGVIRKILKEGKEPIIKILKEFNDLKDANNYEISLISKHGRRDIGTGILTNMTNGGEGTTGYVLTEEHKLAISKARKGHIVTQETRDRMSKSSKGKKLSKETKQKISNSTKGRKKPIGFGQSREGENNPNYGKGLPGEKNGMFGKHHSEETKQRIREGVQRAYRRGKANAS